MVDERLPRSQRIRRWADFQRAFHRRAAAADGLLLVFGCRHEYAYCRLGLSISRKWGGAVARNRWKRRLRAAFRLVKAQLPPGIDLIVIPRSMAQPELAALGQSLVRLAARVTRKIEQME
jgi:ribonuclease P protein component